MQQITFQDKVNINTETSIPEINKLTDDNINKMKQAINLNAPAGVISMYGGSTAPSGWLLCDGSAVSRTTYARLFSAIGTKYGSGNGSTTFNLPNFKGRVPVGLDSSQTEFNSLNKKGGEKTHTLTINEMPSHNHRTEEIAAGLYSGWGNKSDNGWVSAAVQGTGGNWNVGYTGGGQAHNNLQPYITVNYIISY
jgi:microcystin-dependent protein